MIRRCTGVLLLLLCQCQAVTDQPSVADWPSADLTAWQSAFLTDHPLVGRIWDDAGQRFISAEELTARARGVVLLGEKHDNPDHHRLRRALLSQVQARAGLERLVLEMLDESQQPLIDEVARRVEGDPDLLEPQRLQQLLVWDAGWDWEAYGPLLTDLLRQGVPVKAGNITNDQVMSIYQGHQIDGLEIPDVLDETQLELLRQDIDTSHCRMLPESQFDAMVRVQQARDMRMADSLAGRSMPGVTVLVAGNYHIRQDIGVPQYLPVDSVSIAFLEVADGVQDPQRLVREAYAPAAFDYVWFTPASSREDYCAQLHAN